jgi:hypothetical protein
MVKAKRGRKMQAEFPQIPGFFDVTEARLPAGDAENSILG